jgi:hypothetical protein
VGGHHFANGSPDLSADISGVWQILRLAVKDDNQEKHAIAKTEISFACGKDDNPKKQQQHQTPRQKL